MREIVNLATWVAIFGILQEHGIRDWELAAVAVQIFGVIAVSKIVLFFVE